MKNSFDETNNQLAQASYTSWQKTLLDVLRSYKTFPLFDCGEKNLKIDADAFARQFLTQVEDHPVIDEQVPSKFLSVNFGSRKKRQQFFTLTKDIQLLVQELFEDQVQQKFPNISAEEYLVRLLTPLAGNTHHTLAPGLQYPFKNPSSREPSLQQLTLDTSDPKNPVLFQGHTATITIKKTQQFYAELEPTFRRVIDRKSKIR
ncbi:hypothetical protein KDW_07250 [Dictyobacter vulcani]|uniref:Uncharacterized protein n=1 Tax=Dictyobacter vulcani TaxID=2607529 RepID=A0A5J4KFW0_9CHLR|nr:hypothetical protein [Dictyobacter vulcani]GER86563.1 hypothetical protein KDW_07250 [Dictyobacter vulcani]